MRVSLRRSTAALAIVAASVVAAGAQRDTFERSFRAGPGARLDVATNRGKITLTAGDDDQIVVSGTVTARSGLNMPVNRGQLVADAVAHPPIRQQGATVELRPPSDPLVDRAVTIDYSVRVPPAAIVIARSDSGDIDVTLPASSGVTLNATTTSASIDIDSALVDGTVDKNRARGAVHGGGPLWQLTTKSGAIHVK